jgi:hypothetical protein
MRVIQNTNVLNNLKDEYNHCNLRNAGYLSNTRRTKGRRNV